MCWRGVPRTVLPRTTMLLVLLMAVRTEPTPRTEKPTPRAISLNELVPGPKAVCSQLLVLGNKKRNTLATLKRSRDRISRDKELSDGEKDKRFQVLDLFKRELTASERALLIVVKDYERTLKIDFQSLDDIGASCAQRLEDMRGVSLQVEKDYHTFQTLHREIQMQQHNASLPGSSIMEEILKTLAHAADELEVELKENVFDAAVSRGNVEVETVVKLTEGLMGHRHIAGGEGSVGGMDALVLVDPESNQYTLSRPQDTTVPHEDHNLLYDLLLLLLLCSVLGMGVSLLRAPSLFGYILAGVLLGPSGFNVIKSVVQIETMGEFGVFLIMFVVGLEFSPDKLQRVWRVSVYGGNALLLVNVVTGVFLGWVLGMDVKQSAFVASCLSLSSTPLVVRYLEAESSSSRSPLTDHSGGTRPQSEDVSALLLGMLVVQDIQLGAIVALLPLLASHTGTSWNRGVELVKAVGGVSVLVAMARVCFSPRMERFLRVAKAFVAQKEGILLAAIGVCFATILVADVLGVALEVGCFLAGLTIGAKGHGIVERVAPLVEPVKDIASCLFFVSIGFHIFPTFLMSEFYTIAVLTALAILVKFVSSFAILRCFTAQHGWSTLIISTGIAQISEFTFVLGSRGRRLGIVSREVYLLVLSATIVSLLLSPFTWKTALTLAARRDPTLWGKLPPAAGGGAAKY